MSYAAAQDFIDHFGQQEAIDLTDRTGTGAVDYPLLDQTLQAVSEVIDGYLGKRYVLPLPTPLTQLTETACTLARRKLYRNEAPPEVKQAYDEAIAWLEAVRDGHLDLPHTAPRSEVAFEAPARVFDTNTLADY